MRKFIHFLFIFSFSTVLFATSMAYLEANPTYVLPGEEVTFSLTLPSTKGLNSVKFKVSYSDRVETLYASSLQGTLCQDTYTTSGTPQNYSVQAVITYASTTLYSNIATFTTNIPAVSVKSTVVYLSFISQNAERWHFPLKNVGSKPLIFSFSSTLLYLSPSSGVIAPGEERQIDVTENSFILPGKIHVLRAILNTNDPRKHMNSIPVFTAVEGPDGLVISPVKLSNTKVSAGSFVNFSFFIFEHGVNINDVSAYWKTPMNDKIFYYTGGQVFSSNFFTTYPGTYIFKAIEVSYVYKNSPEELIVHPNLTITSYPSEKKMLLTFSPPFVNVEIVSTSTPCVHVMENDTVTPLSVKRVSEKNWEGKYEFESKAGQVSVSATFEDVKYAIVKKFSKYVLGPSSQSLFFDGGWINVQAGSFSTDTLTVVFVQKHPSSQYYQGYEKFNAVSDTVEVSSSTPASKKFVYNLNFNAALVNRNYNKLRVYTFENGKWILQSSIQPYVQGGLAIFSENEGKYVLGVVPIVKNALSPHVENFAIIPRNSKGRTVEFFLSTNKDCYYTLTIYNLRGKVVKIQRGEVMGNFSNLIYNLNPYDLPNGLYVAVIGVGNSPHSVADGMSESFVVTK